MKRLILLMLILALGTFAMFSCKDNDDTPAGDGNGESAGTEEGGDGTLGSGGLFEGGIDPDGWTTPNK